ncbi:MAG: outer membrane beta-barrel protein [Chryseolinea sp.]
MKKIIVVFLVASLVVPLTTYSQSFFALRRERNFLVSLGSGTANYYGEMVNPGELGRLRPNVAAGAEMYLTSRVSVRTELTWFQLYGNDADADDDRVERNLHFRSNNLEFAALGAYNLSPMGQRFYQRSTLNFHAFGGFGLLWINPKAKDANGKWTALQPLRTENVKYSRVQFVIPVGLGARIKIDPFFNILVEGGYRFTFTDYLDDASSTRYADIKPDEGARYYFSDRREGENRPREDRRTIVGKRGNPGKNDGYFIANITLQYYLPNLVFADFYHKLYTTRRKAYYRRPRSQ